MQAPQPNEEAKGKPNRQCDKCKMKDAVLTCSECKTILCQECFALEHSDEAKRQHQPRNEASQSSAYIAPPVPAAKPKKYPCNIHRMKLKYICTDCNVVACSKCMIMGEHKGHSAIPFSDADKHAHEAHDKEIQEYRAVLEKIKELRMATAAKKDAREKSLGTTVEEANADLDAMFIMVEMKREEVLTTLAMECSANEPPVKKVKDFYTACDKSLTAITTEFASLLATTTPANYAKLAAFRVPSSTEIARQTRDLQSKVAKIPDSMSTPVFTMDAVKASLERCTRWIPPGDVRGVRPPQAAKKRESSERNPILAVLKRIGMLMN